MSRTVLAARVAGLVAPTITAAPVLAWTIGVGTSPAITAPTYTGSPGTITYTLKRDGVNVAGVVDVSEATLEAYVTDTSADGACDIGPSMTVEATVTNAAGSDSDTSNAVVYDDATRLPNTAIWISTDGVTTADAGASIDVWASTLGGVSCTITALGAGNRPAHNATGGVGSRPLLTTDGTDDVMTGTLTIGVSPQGATEAAVAGTRVAFGALADRWYGYGSGVTNYWGLCDRTASALYMQGDTSSLIGSGDPDGVNARWWTRRAPAATGSIGHNSTTDATSAGLSLNDRADGGTVMLGGNRAATACANIAIQAFDYGVEPTADQRTEIRALLSYHTGIAC